MKAIQKQPSRSPGKKLLKTLTEWSLYQCYIG